MFVTFVQIGIYSYKTWNKHKTYKLQILKAIVFPEKDS